MGGEGGSRGVRDSLKHFLKCLKTCKGSENWQIFDSLGREKAVGDQEMGAPLVSIWEMNVRYRGGPDFRPGKKLGQNLEREEICHARAVRHGAGGTVNTVRGAMQVDLEQMRKSRRLADGAALDLGEDAGEGRRECRIGSQVAGQRRVTRSTGAQIRGNRGAVAVNSR